MWQQLKRLACRRPNLSMMSTSVLPRTIILQDSIVSLASLRSSGQISGSFLPSTDSFRSVSPATTEPPGSNRHSIHRHKHLGKIISGNHYGLSVNASLPNTASPLLFIKTESRRAALESYRIRFPVYNGHRRIYHDYDVLYLGCWHEASYLIADVLHDLRAYDPENDGIMHIVLAHAEGGRLFDMGESTNLQVGLMVQADFQFDPWMDGRRAAWYCARRPPGDHHVGWYP